MTKGAVMFSLGKSMAVSRRKQAADTGKVVPPRLGGDLQCEVSNLTSVSQTIDKDEKHNWVWEQILFFILCNL